MVFDQSCEVVEQQCSQIEVVRHAVMAGPGLAAPGGPLPCVALQMQCGVSACWGGSCTGVAQGVLTQERRTGLQLVQHRILTLSVASGRCLRGRCGILPGLFVGQPAPRSGLILISAS